MKAWRYLILTAIAAVAVVGCKKEQNSDKPEPGPGPVVEDISGIWALAGEDYSVQATLNIEKVGLESGFAILAPAAGCYFYQDEIYGSIEGVLIESGSVGEKQWSLSGKTLTFGGKAYKKVTRILGETYSSITTTLEDNTITVGSEEQVVHIPYTISPAVPWGELTATKGSASFIGNVAYGEGEVLVSVSAVQSAVSGDVTLHYHGAPDLTVTIRREITRAIVPEWTEKTFDYRQRGRDVLSSAISLPFTILNPSSAYRAGVRIENNPEWISAFIDIDKCRIVIDENNSGASRTAKLLLMYYSESGSDEYPPAPEVPVTITQTFDAPEITFESATGETDYRAKEEIAVPLTVKNPRNYCEISAGTEADWLGCSANTECLYIYVTENQENEARTATITLRYHSWEESFEDAVTTYTLTQRGVEPVVILVEDEVTSDYHGKREHDFRFYYNILNGSGNETFTDDAEWIRDPNRGGWDNDRNCWWGWIQLDANHTTETRTGHVTITDGNSSAVLTVIQTGVQSAIAMDSEMTFNYMGTHFWVNFELLDSSLNEEDMVAESSADWLVPKWRQSHEGSRAYYCQIGFNNSGATREATLTLSIGTESSSMRIIQTYSAPYIHVEPESLSMGYQAGSTWMKCNVANDRVGEEIIYECDADWVTFTPDSQGTTVIVTENKTNLARTATISISYMDGLATRTVPITQGIRDYFDLVLTKQDDPGRGTQYHINWASCNVGATNGDKIGNYYNFSQAQSNLPSGTRLPTLGEWNDFQHAFRWTKTTVGGVVGYVATPKDESNAWIDLYFIPASGYYPIGYSGLYYSDHAFYWSSTPEPNMSNYNWVAWFYYNAEQGGTISTREPFSISDRFPVRVVK